MKTLYEDRYMNAAAMRQGIAAAAQTAAAAAQTAAVKIACISSAAAAAAQTAAAAAQTAATLAITAVYPVHRAFADGWTDVAIAAAADSALETLDPVRVLSVAWRALDYASGCIISSPDYSMGYFVGHDIPLLGVHRTVSSRGHGIALRYRPNQSEWAEIMRRINAAPCYAPIISRAIALTGDGNKGEQFEAAFTHRKPDKSPFWIRADYESGSGTWSIKGSGATLINRMTMIEALRFCREYAPTRFYKAMTEIFT